jgi:hypothetical protein
VAPPLLPSPRYIALLDVSPVLATVFLRDPDPPAKFVMMPLPHVVDFCSIDSQTDPLPEPEPEPEPEPPRPALSRAVGDVVSITQAGIKFAAAPPPPPPVEAPPVKKVAVRVVRQPAPPRPRLGLSRFISVHRKDKFIDATPSEMEVVMDPEPLQPPETEPPSEPARPRLRRSRMAFTIAPKLPEPPESIEIETDDPGAPLEAEPARLSDEASPGSVNRERRSFLDAVREQAIERQFHLAQNNAKRIADLAASLDLYKTAMIRMPMGEYDLQPPPPARVSTEVKVIAVKIPVLEGKPTKRRGTEIPSTVAAAPAARSESAPAESPAEVRPLEPPPSNRRLSDTPSPVDPTAGVSSEDPFKAALQLVESGLRFTGQLGDNAEEVVEVLRSDAQGYAAFLQASRQMNEGHSAFLGNLKDITGVLDRIVANFGIFKRMQDRLMAVIRQCRKNAMTLATQLSEVQQLRSKESLDAQSTALRRVVTSDNVGVLLGQVETALGVVNQLGVAMSPSELTRYHELMDIHQKLIATPVPDVNPVVLDELITRTQDLIVELRQVHTHPGQKVEFLTTLSQSELTQARAELKDLRAKWETLAQMEVRLREKNQHLTDQLAIHVEQLREEQSRREALRALSDAQISTLQNLLHILEGHTQAPRSSSELSAQVYSKVAALKGLLDGQAAECQAAKARLFEIEQELIQRDSLLNEARHALETSEASKADLEERLAKEREKTLFYEADTESRKQGDARSHSLAASQRDLIERLTNENAQFTQQTAALQSKLASQRQLTELLRDQIDDWQLKLALGHFARPPPPTLHQATQTTFKMVVKRPTLPPLAPDLAPGAEALSAPEDPLEIADPFESARIDVGTPTASAPPEADIEWVDAGGPREDNYDVAPLVDVPAVGALVAHTAAEDTFPAVHDPLDYGRSRPKRYFIDAPGRRRAPERRPSVRSSVAASDASHDRNLAIGFNGRPPSRSIQQPTGGTRCKETPLVVPPECDLPLEDAVSTTPLPVRPAPPRKVVTVKLAPVRPLRPPQDAQTLRITSVQFESASTARGPPPLVIPVTKMEPAVPVPGKDSRLDDIQRLVAKLQKTIRALRDDNEAKDAVIAELRDRLSKSLADLNRSRIDGLREKDVANRARTRADSVNARLEAAMAELGERQEELTNARRELLKLRMAAMPAASQLQRMTKAHREQSRLRREADITAELLETTVTMIGKTDDDAVKSYLAELRRHTQETMLRMDRRKKYWKEMEKKQMMGALGALSLLAQDKTEASLMGASDFISTFRTVKKDRKKQKSANEEMRVRPMMVQAPQRQLLFGQTLSLIAQATPPLTDEEKLAIIKRQLSPELKQKMLQAGRNAAPESLDSVVLTNS